MIVVKAEIKFLKRIRGGSMDKQSWVLCPFCSNKIRTRIREDRNW